MPEEAAVQPYGVSVTDGRGGVRVSLWVARALAVCATAAAAVAVALPVLSGLGYLDELLSTPEAVVAVSFSWTGALLVGSPLAVRIGWLLLAVGVGSALFAVSISYTAFVLGGDDHAPLPPGADLAQLTAWIGGWAWVPGWAVVSTVLPQVVPYGRPLSKRWGALLWVSGATITLAVVAFAVAPGATGFFTEVDNPFGSETLDALLDPVVGILDVLLTLLTLVALGSLVVRVLRADGVERRQVGWFGYAVALTVLVAFFGPDYSINVAVLSVPAAIAVAALRYRLYDLDILVNRTLVAGLLLGCAAVAYVALVAWIGAVVGDAGGATPFLAAFGVALLFHPARLWLQARVDRLFFGRRGDPASLVAELDRALRDAKDPREALAAAVEVVRRGLRLSGVEVTVPVSPTSTVVERAGTVDADAERFPLVLHGEHVGTLVAGGRPGGPLTGTDLRVLHTLSGPVASAAFALRLSGDLEESRRRLLETREDERRRLRRDLHDGLGPQLAGVVMGLDVARSSLARGRTARAEELVGTVAEQARTAVEDVRRLVAGLRPPVLDDLGLLEALRTTGPAAQEGPPVVRFHVHGDLTSLPAAVEVAAYFIVGEALTNVVRHASATAADVRLEATQDVLTVLVEDDGVGFPEGASKGVGLVSMRERAVELGGGCAVTATGKGTRVRAELPLLPGVTS